MNRVVHQFIVDRRPKAGFQLELWLSHWRFMIEKLAACELLSQVRVGGGWMAALPFLERRRSHRT